MPMFCQKLDKLFASLSGESLSGRYTDQIYIQVRKARLEGIAWGEDTASDQITCDGALLSVVLAVLY